MTEQVRADRLAQEFERLMTGQGITGDDPLLDVARKLAQAPVQPGAGAQQRFEQQLAQWFGAPAGPPPAPPSASPLPVAIIAAITIGAAALLIGTALGGSGIQATPAMVSTMTITQTSTPTASVTPTGTATPTATATATTTATVTETATLTATPTVTTTETPASETPDAASTSQALPLTTPVPGIVRGRIEDIRGILITVNRQRIQVRGGVAGLCVGDLVRVETTVQGELLRTERSAVRVEQSACRPTAIPKDKKGGGNDD